MSISDRAREGLKKAGQLVRRGKEIAIRQAEKNLRIERLRMDVSDLKKKKESHMKILANRVYELYTRNAVTDPDLLSLCQEVKTLQWQIDEKWSEINQLKQEKI